MQFTTGLDQLYLMQHWNRIDSMDGQVRLSKDNNSLAAKQEEEPR